MTAGGLVFTGRLTGEFMAVDSADGKILWEFQTSSGIVGQPITWVPKKFRQAHSSTPTTARTAMENNCETRAVELFSTFGGCARRIGTGSSTWCRLRRPVTNEVMATAPPSA